MAKWALAMVAMKDARFIKRVLEPFRNIKRKVVLVSSAPWGKPEEVVDNTELLHELSEAECEIHVGYWETEEDQRNEAMSLLKDEDFVWIVDTDEIYKEAEVRVAQEFVERYAHADVYYIRQDIYWKSKDYKVIIDHLYAGIAIVRAAVRFTTKRNYNPLTNVSMHIPGHVIKCDHMSFVGSDEEILDKLKYNGHRDEFYDDWFEQVWKRWKPEMQNLHPGRPEMFLKAVPAC